jgi:hypothetical protein
MISSCPVRLIFLLSPFTTLTVPPLTTSQSTAMSEEEKAQEIQTEGEKQPETIEQLRKTITVDTIHNDEALKVLANYAGDEEWTEEEEKKLVRKIDRRLLSILCLTYGL